MINVNKVFDGGFDIKLVGTSGTLVDEYVSLTEYLVIHMPELSEEIHKEMERRARIHDNDPGEH